MSGDVSAVGDAPEARLVALAELVRYHNRRYHELDDPEISDGDFDALVRELRSLAQAYPDVEFDNPLAVDVGGTASTLFAPVTHAEPMMSLDNAMTREEVEAWGARVARGLPDETVTYVCELKIDGLAMSIRYERGRYTQAATRGDGRVGEDVTANVATIAAVPRTLEVSAGTVPDVLEVRGEVYMPVASFERLNEAAAAAGTRPFVNPRNSAAGSLRQKDASITAQRDLSFWSYQLGAVDGGPSLTSHSESLAYLKSLGLPVNPETKTFTSLDEVLGHCKHWEEHRHDLGYEIDGVVIKVDDVDQRSRLGFTSRLRDGRSPTSSRPKSARRCCATSKCRSVGRAGRRHSPSSTQCSSAGRPSWRRRCTTRTRCAPRTCGSATR